MSYWTSDHMVAKGDAIVRPFDAAQVVNCSYELKLGPEGYVTGGEVGRKTFLASDGDQLMIPPGQFALLLSEESVAIPEDAIGFISVKFGFKVFGLVNVSGFHVDPGFRGRLIFSVYNAGSTEVVISRGERVFMLWLADLEGRSPDPYVGSHAGQHTIGNRDIMMLGRPLFSPAALNDRLRRLEERISTLIRIGEGILIVILAAIVLALATQAGRVLVGRTNPKPNPSITASALNSRAVSPLP